jgi:Fe-S-cluster-containing hydrogenase component 2
LEVERPMHRAVVRGDVCLNCRPCPPEEGCTMKAFFRESPDDKPWVDFYRCGGCLECKPRCPAHAIESIDQPCDGKPRSGW